MNEQMVTSNEANKAYKKAKSNLLTVIVSLSFVCICLFLSNIYLGAYTVSAIDERDAVSTALDDQRAQYYLCVRDNQSTAECPQELVSPPSRDIKRDLEAAGFSEILYSDSILIPGTSDDDESSPLKDRPREAFGVLGSIIYR